MTIISFGQKLPERWLFARTCSLFCNQWINYQWINYIQDLWLFKRRRGVWVCDGGGGGWGDDSHTWSVVQCFCLCVGCIFKLFFPARDQSLPIQPISIRKAQSRKTAHLCAPRAFLKCVGHYGDHTILLFDCRISEPFTCSRCLFFVSCNLVPRALRVRSSRRKLLTRRALGTRFCFVLSTT